MSLSMKVSGTADIINAAHRGSYDGHTAEKSLIMILSWVRVLCGVFLYLIEFPGLSPCDSTSCSAEIMLRTQRSLLPDMLRAESLSKACFSAFSFLFLMKAIV